MPQKVSGATDSHTCVADAEEMIPETKQNRLTSPGQMNLEVQSVKCQKHWLVSTTIPSMDKCVQCVGPVSSFKWLGYQCTDDIQLSDAEVKDSGSEADDSGTEASACGTRQPVDVASEFTIIDQVHDSEETETVSLVPSTKDETAILPERDNGVAESESKRVTRKRWSKAEVAAVMRHFRKHICNGSLATKKECSHCKVVEEPVLAERTVQNIRDLVRNRGIAAKRRSQKGKL
ncbi:uncharacterized protein [Labrus bergylta]|uniref:uncharacterized protein n=1 Tax=Labrus bergylta TaxID=56723 RepID=UPI00331322CD